MVDKLKVVERKVRALMDGKSSSNASGTPSSSIRDQLKR